MSLSKGTVLQQRYRIVQEVGRGGFGAVYRACLLYTSPSPRDGLLSRMPSSA